MAAFVSGLKSSGFQAQWEKRASLPEASVDISRTAIMLWSLQAIPEPNTVCPGGCKTLTCHAQICSIKTTRKRVGGRRSQGGGRLGRERLSRQKSWTCPGFLVRGPPPQKLISTKQCLQFRGIGRIKILQRNSK